MNDLSALKGELPAALKAQRARVAAVRQSPDGAHDAGRFEPPIIQDSATSVPASRPQPDRRCVLQFEAPLDFVRIEFPAAEVSIEETSITVLFRQDFRLHLGDLKPRLVLRVDADEHTVAYLGGMFQISSLGLRGMTFVRILPEA